jgi:hypothetical protein
MSILAAPSLHAYSRASLEIYLGCALLLAASAWIRPVALHPAYGSGISFAGWSFVAIESWMRHGRATSLYACFDSLMGAAFVAILWISRRSAQIDDPDSRDEPTS